jgi:hypothetical protein
MKQYAYCFTQQQQIMYTAPFGRRATRCTLPETGAKRPLQCKTLPTAKIMRNMFCYPDRFDDDSEIKKQRTYET